MKIPLPKMMRHWREREFEKQLSPATLSLRPRRSGPSSRSARRSIGCARRDRRARPRHVGGARGRFRTLPLAGGWTDVRDMPAPRGPQLPELCGPSGSAHAPTRHERRPRPDSRRHPPLAEARRARCRTQAGAARAAARAHRSAISSRRAPPALDHAGAGRALRRHGRGGADDGDARRRPRRRAGRGRRLSRAAEPAGRVWS